MIPRPPSSPLFPYTALFRSTPAAGAARQGAQERPEAGRQRVDHRRRQGDPALAQRLRSEEHTSELQSHVNLVCRLLLEKKNKMGGHARSTTVTVQHVVWKHS